MVAQHSAAFQYSQNGAASAVNDLPQSPLRLLLIEDNSSDALYIKHELKHNPLQCHVSVVHVTTIFAALEMLYLARFHLVLLDLNLLDSEGLASLAALRADAPDVSVIVYSGTDDPQLRENALFFGAKHYLVKGQTHDIKLGSFLCDELIKSSTKGNQP